MKSSSSSATRYHFAWLSGDDVVQSLVHNLDRATWAMREQTPVKAHGLGGRSASFGEVYGNIFDHHRWSTSMPTACGCTPSAGRRTAATTSTAAFTWAPRAAAISLAHRIKGENQLEVFRRQASNPYDIEHAALFGAIRSGKPVNAGDYMARSTLVAVMGQLACYSGQELTWEQVSKSNFVFLPQAEDVRLDMEPPVKPDAAGNYPVPMPGITTLTV